MKKFDVLWINPNIFLFPQKISLNFPFFPDGLIFYLHGFVGGLLFFHLAKQWPAILQSFTKVEGILQTEAYAYLDGWQIKKKIRMTSLVLFSVAFSEHFISWINFLYDRLTQAKLCKWQIDNYFYYLAYHHLYQVYQELPLNPFTVAWGEYMNVSFAFAWSFIDLFVILVSMGISSMFMKINKRLEFFHGRVSASNKDNGMPIFIQANHFTDCER